MLYLITHIAIFLVFAQLLGLLLGWLLWGYLARQRGLEVVALRQRVADYHLASARMALAADSRPSLPEPPGALIEGDLPEAETIPVSFFEQELEEPSPEPVPEPIPEPAFVLPDLEAEVRASKLEHLEQQVRELESVRDRLPLMQADLSDAIAGRRAAESKYQEAKHDFEIRSSNLLAQIRDFENAAKEWDRHRDEIGRAQLAKDKELSTVKAHLRDLQNSQRPQTAEPLVASPSAAAIELADLRDRYQRALRERDSIAEELEFWKQNDSSRSTDSTHLTQRIAELEEVISGKDSNLKEQVARVETLLWRVAELEPFAANAQLMEENLKRQESEIAGHMAMHSENADEIRALHSRISALESDTSSADALKSELARVTAEHAHELEAVQHKLAATENLLSEHDSQNAERIQSLEKHIAEMEAAAAALVAESAALKHQLDESAATLQRLTETHAQELEAAHQKLAASEQSLAEHTSQSADRIGVLEKQIAGLESAAAAASAESQRLTQDQAARLAELQQSIKQHQDEIANHLTAHQTHENVIAGLRARTAELEVVAHKVAALERTLIDRDTEIRGLLSAHGDMHREMQGWKDYSAQLQPVADHVPVLESTLKDRESEIQRLKQAHGEKETQLSQLQERLNAISARLSWHQHRLQELEPLAAKIPELSRREEESRNHFKLLAEKHQTELTKMKINSAQRLRRLRQGITNFKG